MPLTYKIDPVTRYVYISYLIPEYPKKYSGPAYKF